MIDRNRLAVYLDEAGDDPATACATLARLGVSQVCLRQIWTGNVCNASDQALEKLKELLSKHALTVVMIASDLNRYDTDPDRPFLLARYFAAPLVRVWGGQDGDFSWMERVGRLAVQTNVTPLLEPHPEQLPFSTVDLARVLQLYPQWRLLYDPVQLVLGGHREPFQKYWTLLKSKIAALDIRDMAWPPQPRVPGGGICEVRRTLQDALNIGYKGWYLLEPGLGRRFGQTLGRDNTFAVAFDALKALEQ